MTTIWYRRSQLVVSPSRPALNEIASVFIGSEFRKKRRHRFRTRPVLSCGMDHTAEGWEAGALTNTGGSREQSAASSSRCKCRESRAKSSRDGHLLTSRTRIHSTRFLTGFLCVLRAERRERVDRGGQLRMQPDSRESGGIGCTHCHKIHCAADPW